MDNFKIECECCDRSIVEKKLKGIGYVCDDCLGPYWVDIDDKNSHWPVCPFKEIDAK